MKLKINQYQLTIKEGLMNDFNEIVTGLYNGNKIFVITDENLYKIYSDKLINLFSRFELEFIVVPAGEHSKSMHVFEKVCGQLIQKSIRRNHLMIAFGGGVIGDLAGFVAGTILRGIPFIQIPTSLLAMVDSSIGGKTGLDTAQGKNLIGLFNDPKAVLIDPNFLETLPEEEYRNGLAEVLKAGIIGDKSIVDFFKNNDRLTVNEIIKAIEVKRKIVTVDPFEKNERMFLNFGHTFGHAIEMHFDYAIKHGIAVSYGMIIALEEGLKLGITPKVIVDQVIDILLKLKLVKKPFMKKEDFLHLITNDKKQLSDGLRFVVIRNFEKPEIIKGVKF